MITMQDDLVFTLDDIKWGKCGGGIVSIASEDKVIWLSDPTHMGATLQQVCCGQRFA